jgi:hypothetical protein
MADTAAYHDQSVRGRPNDVLAYLASFVQSQIAKWAVPIETSGVSVD